MRTSSARSLLACKSPTFEHDPRARPVAPYVKTKPTARENNRLSVEEIRESDYL
jgi:hypothetical protein